MVDKVTETFAGQLPEKKAFLPCQAGVPSTFLIHPSLQRKNGFYLAKQGYRQIFWFLLPPGGKKASLTTNRQPWQKHDYTEAMRGIRYSSSRPLWATLVEVAVSEVRIQFNRMILLRPWRAHAARITSTSCMMQDARAACFCAKVSTESEKSSSGVRPVRSLVGV